MARMARTSQQDLQYGTMLTNHALHNPEIFCLAFFSLSAFSLLFQTTVLWKIFSWVPKVDFIRRFSSGSSRIPPISAAHMLDRLLVFFSSLWLVYLSQSHRFTSPWAKQLSWRLTWNRSDTPVLLRSSTNIKLDKLSFATIIISAFLFRSVFIFFFFFFFFNCIYLDCLLFCSFVFCAFFFARCFFCNRAGTDVQWKRAKCIFPKVFLFVSLWEQKAFQSEWQNQSQFFFDLNLVNCDINDDYFFFSFCLCWWELGILWSWTEKKSVRYVPYVRLSKSRTKHVDEDGYSVSRVLDNRLCVLWDILFAVPVPVNAAHGLFFHLLVDWSCTRKKWTQMGRTNHKTDGAEGLSMHDIVAPKRTMSRRVMCKRQNSNNPPPMQTDSSEYLKKLLQHKSNAPP